MRESELHELISRGRNLAGRLDELAVLLAHLQEHPVTEAQPTEAARIERPTESSPSLAERLAALGQATAAPFVRVADGAGGYYTAPVLYLVAAPTTAVTIPTLFREIGVRQKLENPPATRQDGWNLMTLNRAELVEGNRLSVTSGRRKLIELHEDGTLVAVAPAERLLVRDRLEAEEPGGKMLLKINSLGLVEFVHDFVLTYLDLVAYFEPQPEHAYFLIGIDSAKSTAAGELFLPPHGVETIGWMTADGFNRKPPDADRLVWGCTAPLHDNAGAIAYPLLERVYAYFKHTSEAIPYLNEQRDAVDPDAFSKARRR